MAYFGDSDAARLEVIANGVNFALAFEEDEKKEYIKEATALRQAQRIRKFPFCQRNIWRKSAELIENVQ